MPAVPAVYVATSLIRDAGRGLFAGINFKPGDIVVNMDKPQVLSIEAWEERRTNTDLPHDAVIENPMTSLVHADGAFEPNKEPPLWYFMNHKKKGNTKPIIANPHDGCNEQEVVWAAIREIRWGEELTYSYANVPSLWNK